MREYATYQRLQGEEILKKQEQIRKKKAERQQVKAAKEGLLKERENEKAKLEAQEKEKRHWWLICKRNRKVCKAK